MRKILSLLCSFSLFILNFQAFAIENAGVEAESARLERERVQTEAVSNQVLAALQANEKEVRDASEVKETEEELASDYSIQMVAEQVELCKEKNGSWKKGMVQLPTEPEPFDCTHLALLEFEILKQQAGDNLNGESAALVCATKGWKKDDRLDFAKQLEGLGKLKHGIDEHFSCPGKNESTLSCARDVGCKVLKAGMAVSTAGLSLGVEKVMDVFGVKAPICSKDTLSKGSGLNYLGSCLTEAVWGVWKDLVSNVEGIWDIAKMGWSAVKGVASKAWGWVSSWWGNSDKAEDSTSIKQAFMESKPDSFFTKFINDPVGTFSEMMSGFMSYIGDSIQSNFGCAEWEESRLMNPINPPHCKTPVVSWKCASCEQKVQMACGTVGFVGGEVLLSFLTGGAINVAAKVGKTAAATKVAKAVSISGKFTGRLKAVDYAVKGFGISKRTALGLVARGGNFAVKVGSKLYKFRPSAAEKMLKVLRGGKKALSAVAYPFKKYGDLMEEAFVFGASGMSREAVRDLRAARLASKSIDGIRKIKTAGMSESAVSKFDDVGKAAEELRKAREQLLAAAKKGKADDASKTAFELARKNIDDATKKMVEARQALQAQVKTDDIAKAQQVARAKEAEQRARDAEKARLLAERKAKEAAEAQRKLKAEEDARLLAQQQQRARDAAEAQRKIREAEAAQKRARDSQRAADAAEAQRKLKQAQANQTKMLESQKLADTAEAERKLKAAADQAKKQRDALKAQKDADEAAEASRIARQVADQEKTALEAARAEKSRKLLLANNTDEVSKTTKTTKADDVTDGSKIDDAGTLTLKSDTTPVASSGPARRPAKKPKEVKPTTIPKASKVDDAVAIEKPIVPDNLGAKGDRVEVAIKGSPEPLRGKIIDSSPNGVTLRQADGIDVSIPARNIDGARTKNLFETPNIPGLNIAKPGDNVVLLTSKGERISGQIEKVNDKSIRLIGENGKSVSIRTRDLDVSSVQLTRNGQDPMGQAMKAADTSSDVGQISAANKKDDLGTIIDDVDQVVPVSNLPVPVPAASTALTKTDDGLRLVSKISDDVADRLGPFSILQSKKVDLVDPKNGVRIKGATLERAELLPDGSYIHHYRTADGNTVKIDLGKDQLMMDLSKLGRGEVHYVSSESSQARRAMVEGRMSELRMNRVIEHEGVPIRLSGNKAVARIEDLSASKQTHILLLEDGTKLKGKILSYKNGFIEMRLANGKIIKFLFPKKLVMLGKAGQLIDLISNSSDYQDRIRRGVADNVPPVKGPKTDPAGDDPAKKDSSETTFEDEDTAVNVYDLDPTKGGKAVQYKPTYIIPPPEGFSGILRGMN